ncbi:UPF0481 protein [Cucumis melo var. makuwa]|uniref:UPF0481 protein n=1 Tax=Cucumis melo var. makuwa TaxID=1194695 RepID=A0A5A7VD32_CUCMM|nr:UPF0481 protein [Cucumis melo var. makuwa]
MIQANHDITYKVEEPITGDADQELCVNVVMFIKNILEQVPQVNPKICIYRISKEVRELNDRAYAPQFISIGPFHYHTRQDLIANEYYKYQGFNNFLRRISINNEQIESMEGSQVKINTVKFLVEKCHGLMKEAWNCYADQINMMEEEFVGMMLVDACFIVEFLILLRGRVSNIQRIISKIDSKFYQGALYEILGDLIKLENQVPFFLLQSLFDLITKDDLPLVGTHERASLMDLTCFAFKIFVVAGYHFNYMYDKTTPKHLVDFSSIFFMSPPTYVEDNHKYVHTKDRWCISPSVTTLWEAGVTIQPSYVESCLTSISFENGVLNIPHINMGKTFEIMIRNLIAFDHYPAGNKNMYAVEYVSFLHDLMKEEQDVHLLVKVGVIVNSVGGGDKYILDFFNNLSRYNMVSPFSQFGEIAETLHVYCNRRRNRAKRYWNKAKVTLRHDYFTTPWTTISVIAATFLILLTLLQTIFSAISAFPG